MTTATIWDEALGQDRPLTEEGVRKLQEDALNNEEITVAEQQEALSNFKLNVDAYIRIRGQIDPEWRRVPETDDEDADFDFYGDSISIEWKEYDRCGDRDYFRRDFPLEHLWHPDWESLLTGERDQRVQAEKKAREADEAKRKAAKEAAERRQLADLLAKYGVPPEYQAQEAGHG